MMDKRKLLKLVVLAFGVSILLLVFGYTNGPKIVDEHTIRYVLEQEPSTLDPAKSSTTSLSNLRLSIMVMHPLQILS